MRTSRRLPNVHPGEVLAEEFLLPMGLSRYRLARDLGVPATRVGEICAGRRAVTADTALRLAAYFGTSARLWLGLQQDFDLEASRRRQGRVLAQIERAGRRRAG